MGMPAAANSVLAKARAMYGKRMTAQNYSELLSCRSVGEAASYLREHTAYKSVFDGVPMGALHRRQLETLVHDHLSTQFASLCRYEKFIGDGFSAHFVMRSDVELLLHAIRRINRTHPDDFPKVLPPFFYRHSNIDVQSIGKVTDFNSLLLAAEGSPYKAVLEPFASRGEGGSPDYFGMELALNKYYRLAVFEYGIVYLFAFLCAYVATHFRQDFQGVENIVPQGIDERHYQSRFCRFLRWKVSFQILDTLRDLFD